MPRRRAARTGCTQPAGRRRTLRDERCPAPCTLSSLSRHSLATRRSTPVRGTPRTAHSLSAPARLAVGSRDAATCMSRVPGETSPHRACAALSFESAMRGARSRWEGRCGEQITFLRKRCILLSLGASRPCRGVDAYKIPPLTESPRRGSVRLARCHPKPSKWTTTISSQRAGLLCRGSWRPDQVCVARAAQPAP